MNNENLVSVIIPIYNVPEDLLDQCLKSIFCQTYKNIEIILVDDGTNVNNKEYIRSLTNSNVKIITHKKNCGLYAARITGVKNASGKWICFVDADDHISVDWIRLLVKKAEKENADIVMGNTICEEINENGERTQYVFAPSANFLKNRENILGGDIFSLLMEDEGRFFQLHTVWNKIYSRSLWTRAFQSLLSYQTHLIMTEDILFSTILFFYAEKMSFSDHDGYFYFRNDFSSTKDIYGLKKSIKNFSDLKVSFSSCLNFMVEMGVYETYKKHYKVMKDRYFRWWSNTIKNATQGEYDSEKASLQNDFLTFFEKKKFSDCYDEDSFMDAHRVSWNPRLEIIKKTIANEKNHVISFDIFDTLFVRNTLHPEDILEIISYEKPLLNEYNFKEYRQIAEELCRKNTNSTNPSWQDVNLTEIYDSLQELLKIDDATKVDLMQTEIETESKFLMVRGIGKELFELALYLEKEIILISDMYLEENTVLHILSNAGFSGINKLYLSSRYRALKATGRLYEIVRADYPDKQIVHIGDNWNSDFIVPQQYGIQSFFLPKNSDILFNRLGDSYTGNSIGNAVRNQNSIIDLSQHLKKLPVRCLYASVANLMFDNPFASSAEEGDYNMDPYFIGVNALGMYEFGISLWICKQMKAENRKRILFTARDGYYIKKIFDYINEKWYNKQFESDYIFVSRRSLIPIRICTPRDVLSIRNRTNWKNQSSKSILKIYQEIFVDYETIGKQIIIQEGFSLENRFQSEMEFVSFLKMASEKLFDVEKAQKARNICEKYMKGHISKGDVIFDLGYSGKMHADIVAAMGFSVDGYYVNSSGFDAMYRAKDNRFNIQCYYDFIPTMSGVINEFIMSDTNSSCIGYHDCIDGQPEPVFENTVINGVNRYVVEEIQRGAFDFARYNVDHYHEYQKYMLFQGIDMGVQYEKFLMHMQEYDRKLFDCCTIEDQYYGGVIQNPLLDVWGWQVKDRQLYNVIVEDVTIQKSLYIAREMTADAALSPDSRWYISDVSLAWQLYHDKGMEKKSKIQKILFWLVNDRAYLKRRFKEKYR